MTKRQQEAIYERCILYRHAMGDAPASTPTTVTFGFVLRCERGCGTYRHLEIDPTTGQVTHSRYDQPQAYKEYRRTRGTQADIRLDILKARARKNRLRKVS